MLNPSNSDGVRNKNSIAPESANLEQQPMQIFGKRYPTYALTNLLVKYPTVFCAIFAFIPMLLTILSISVDPIVERGVSSFAISDHPSAKSLATERIMVSQWRVLFDRSLVNAAAEQQARSDRGEQKYRIFINYRASPGKLRRFLGQGFTDEALRDEMNLLNGRHLEYIRNIERDINLLPGYRSVCWRSPFRAGDVTRVSAFLPECTPLTSLLTYFYIGLFDNSSSLWEFDGFTGARQIPHDRVLDRVFINPRHRWFMDQSASTDNRLTTLLRSQVTFGWPARSVSGSLMASESEYNQRYDAFLARLLDLVDSAEPHQFIEITVGGDRVDEGLVEKALRRDAVYVTLSLVIVFAVLVYHFHSFILGLMGVLQVAMTYPASFFLYVASSGTQSISLLTSLSLYVAMVISVDAMMIWFDTFNHSGFMSTNGRKNTLTIAQRTAYTFRKAGVGISVSSLVAFTAFMMNLASTVPAIRTFSGMMGTLIAFNWFLMMTFFPAAVLFHHFHVSGRRRNLQRQKEILLSHGQRSRFPPQAYFHHELEALNAKFNVTGYREAKAYMQAELDAEVIERKRERGFFQRLGVTPVRLPNPFNKHVEVESPYRVTDAEAIAKEAADFMDQFADATSGSSVTADVHTTDPATVLQIAHFNCDEMLAFDDTHLRHQLVESGHRNAAEFLPAQLVSLAPAMGIVAATDRASWRVPIVARTAIYLLFGVARTLQPTVKHQKKGAPPAGARPGFAASEVSRDRVGFVDRVANWYKSRQGVRRKWCCGLLGQRVGETDAEREARIMQKRVKHQGYSRMEMFLFNYWAPALHKLRIPLTVLAVCLLVGATIRSSFLSFSNAPPRLLGPNRMDEYEDVAVQFAETGSCDYCSAFFRPRTDFPVPDFSAILACAQQNVHSTQMMHARVDDCGVCDGDNACFDCAGVRGGTARFDACDQCLEPSDFRFGNCTRCSWHSRGRPECTYCFTQLSRGRHLNGRNCTAYCDPATNCLPVHGTCNPVTGQCECHADFINGFWESDPDSVSSDSFMSTFCSRCKNGFVGNRCTVECEEEGVQPCSCNVSAGRCTRCLNGLIGPQCAIRDRSVCDNGHMSPGFCECDPGFNDGMGCRFHELCSYRGTLIGSFHAPPEFAGCLCSGQFRGLRCEVCQCYNGGTCDREGKCICPTGWTGVDCSACPGSCIANGRCPRPWRPLQYTVDKCRANFCADIELRDRFAASQNCRLCGNHSTFTLNSTCSSSSFESCLGKMGFLMNGSVVTDIAVTCVPDPISLRCLANTSEPVDVVNEECQCKGSFGGNNCDTCIKPTGLTELALEDIRCRSDGVLVGCDGLPAVDGRLRVRDSCGTCGGSGSCPGCDGIPGSDKRLDDCGVCGGNNECPGAVTGDSIVRTTASISFLFGVAENGTPDPEFDPNDPALQRHMFQICSQVLAREDLVRRGQSTCAWYNFVLWTRDVWRLPHPIVDRDVVPLLFEFIRTNGTGLATEVGFSGTNPLDPNLRVTFIRFAFMSADVDPFADFRELETRYDFWRRVLANLNNPEISGTNAKAIMASETWVRYFTQQAAFKGTIFSMTLGGAVFVAAILTLTCSLTLSLLSTFVLISSVVSVLAMFMMLGWNIGPVEQVAMTFLLGASSEQVVHMAEGYLEYLHSAQSHLFARDTTTLQAVKGMLQRTGVSIILSAVTIVVCSSLLLAAELRVFNKVGEIIIIIVLTTLVHNIVLFGAILCWVGPVTTFRNRKTMALFGAIGAAVFLIIALPLLLTRAIAVE